MLLVILLVCATVSAVPWYNEVTSTVASSPATTTYRYGRDWYTTMAPTSRDPRYEVEAYNTSELLEYPTYKEESRRPHSHEEGRHHPHTEGDRYRWSPEEGRHRHSYGEERRHSYHEEDRYRPYHEEDRYRQLAKEQICSGDFLKKYDGVGPGARYHKILSVTVQFEHGNRTVSCTNNGHYHHHHHRHY